MTTNIQDLLALANQAAAVGPDMTEVKSGGVSKAFSRDCICYSGRVHRVRQPCAGVQR